MSKTILIIDDDKELQERLVEYLQEYGFTVLSHYSGDKAVERIAETAPHLVILDIMMPVMDGLEVLQEMRKSSIVPVLMLTARGDDMDRVIGLEVGADDYLPKPFNPRELLARIKAILRREEMAQTAGFPAREHGETLACGPLRLDPAVRKLLYQDRTADLSATEYRIMEILIRDKNTIISRDRMMQEIHGRQLEPYDRSIDVQISRLRACLETLTGTREWIKTYRGSGYMLADNP